MARTVTNYDISTRTARAELAAGKSKKHGAAAVRTGAVNKPYWHAVIGPVSLGWQAPAAAGIGGRWYARKSFGGGQYSTQLIGTADDCAAADGERVMSYAQAQSAALVEFNADRTAAAGDLTVRDAVAAYLLASESNHVAAMTRQAEAEIFSSGHLDKGRALVRELTRAQLLRWRSELVAGLQARKRAAIAAGRAPESADEIVRKSKDSANKVLSLLNAALNHAFASPANGLKSDTEWRIALRKFGKVSRARQHHFTQADMQRLIDRCPDAAFALMLTAGFLTGARYGELRTANVRDFNPATGILRLSGKTGERFVPLSADTAAFIAAQCRDKLPAAPLFTRADGSRWGKWHQQAPMKRALAAAGLDSAATFYATRHSHISRCIEAGMPIAMIAENCGTSVRMIEENYAHVLASKKREFLDRVGLRISAAPLAVAA